MKAAIAVIILMFIWIPLFVWSTKKYRGRIYLFTKSLSSVLFLAIGILGHFAKTAPNNYSLFIVISLCFGLVGDVFLVYSDNKFCFASGLFSFLIGHVIYGVLFLNDSGLSTYDFILFAAIVAASLFVYSKSSIDLGDMKLPAFFYLLAISFMYAMALSTIYKQSYPSAVSAAIVLGSTLFALSDAVLAFSMFSKSPKPALFQINLLVYYYGQMIIAASIIMFSIAK